MVVVVIIGSQGNPVIMLLLRSRCGLGLGLSVCLRMLMICLMSMLLLVMGLLMMILLVMCPRSVALRILMLVREDVIRREHRHPRTTRED